MSQVEWYAQRGRPGVPIVPASRFIVPEKKPPPKRRSHKKREPAAPRVFHVHKRVQMTDAALAIALEVGRKYDVTLDEMMSAERRHNFVLARHETWWRMRHELGHSYPRIGRAFGKDHTSIVHGVQRYEERMRGAEKDEGTPLDVMERIAKQAESWEDYCERIDIHQAARNEV